jgi:predicted nucleic acid-binding protein
LGRIRAAEEIPPAKPQAPKSAHIQDAHLAALAIERGATLCSTDADFSRFPVLKWLNPLKSEGPVSGPQ